MAPACSCPWPAVTPPRHWTADSSSGWWFHRDHPAFFCLGFQNCRHQEWESANALDGHREANPMDMGGCSDGTEDQPGLLLQYSPLCWPQLPSFCSIRPIQGIPSRCAGSCASSEAAVIQSDLQPCPLMPLAGRWVRLGTTALSSRSADRAVASPMVSSQEGRW